MSEATVTPDKTTIKVEKSTAEMLRTFGIKGESYDTVIMRLCDFWRKGHPYHEDSITQISVNNVERGKD